MILTLTTQYPPAYKQILVDGLEETFTNSVNVKVVVTHSQDNDM